MSRSKSFVLFQSLIVLFSVLIAGQHQEAFGQSTPPKPNGRVRPCPDDTRPDEPNFLEQMCKGKVVLSWYDLMCLNQLDPNYPAPKLDNNGVPQKPNSTENGEICFRCTGDPGNPVETTPCFAQYKGYTACGGQGAECRDKVVKMRQLCEPEEKAYPKVAKTRRCAAATADAQSCISRCMTAKKKRTKSATTQSGAL